MKFRKVEYVKISVVKKCEVAHVNVANPGQDYSSSK